MVTFFDFYASCSSTHSIEFALQIHKFREHVSRNLYKGRKNVSAGRGFSSRFARKRGFEREAVRKTKFFDSLTPHLLDSIPYCLTNGVQFILKPASYFSLLRIKCDEEKCISCGKCKSVCPMDVDVTDNSRKRKNGTECILCMECVKNCPKKAL